MMADDTQLNEPVTPAPVFALRALRSIFFNSPDSSPEKENIPMLASLKEIDNLRKEGCETPKQSQRDFDVGVSPTKSILRQPGMPTPRRAMLRDVTVTFKDIRKSLSPEVVRKNSEVTVKPSNPETKVEQVTVRPSKEEPDQRRTSAQQKRGTKAVKQDLKDNPAHTKFATLEDDEHSTRYGEYIRNTEREMKKLIRYGQKMKEYARKQDIENTKLRQMVELLQAENKRLRQAEERRQKDQDSRGKSMAVVPESSEEPVKPSQPRRQAELKRPGNAAFPQLGQDTHVTTINSHEYGTAQHAKRGVSMVSPDRPENNKTTLTNTNQKQARHTSLSAIDTHRKDTSQPVTDPQSLQDERIKFATTRLAPHRVAAARERLRQRTQSRKTNVDANESNVDWAGL